MAWLIALALVAQYLMAGYNVVMRISSITLALLNRLFPDVIAGVYQDGFNDGYEACADEESEPVDDDKVVISEAMARIFSQPVKIRGDE